MPFKLILLRLARESYDIFLADTITEPPAGTRKKEAKDADLRREVLTFLC